MGEPVDVRAAAQDIHSRIQHGEHFPGAWQGKFTLAEAYRIQLAIRDLRVAEGDRQTGWKIGLTARAVQEQEGFYEPIFAVLYESGSRASGAVFERKNMINPGFENELCITLRHALRGPDVDAAAVRGAIATVAPALEIVEGRGALSDSPELAVADNLGQMAYVVGTPVRPEPGSVLADAQCAVKVNDLSIATADGSAVLDDPCNAIAWLANKLADYNEEILAGQMIMSGSFTRSFPIEATSTVETHFQPFGAVGGAFV